MLKAQGGNDFKVEHRRTTQQQKRGDLATAVNIDRGI